MRIPLKHPREEMCAPQIATETLHGRPSWSHWLLDPILEAYSWEVCLQIRSADGSTDAVEGASSDAHDDQGEEEGNDANEEVADGARENAWHYLQEPQGCFHQPIPYLDLGEVVEAGDMDSRTLDRVEDVGEEVHLAGL